MVAANNKDKEMSGGGGDDSGGGQQQPQQQSAADSAAAAPSSNKAPKQTKSSGGGGGGTANKRVSLSVNTSADAVAASSSAAPPSTTSTTPTPRSTASPNPAQDMHPFARGAVIEVWHIPKTSNTSAEQQEQHPNDEWWWTESEGDEDDDDDDSDENDDDKSTTASNTTNSSANNNNNNTAKQQAHNHHHARKKQQQHYHHHHHSNRTVRLCDIIDRAQQQQTADGGAQQQQWRYYVHYRDFNRRMDEWISVDRIVSPPSVGNAKARALKREEERMKRKQQRKEEKEQILAAAAVSNSTGDGPPARSRRRSSAAGSMPDASSLVGAVGGAAAGAAAGSTAAAAAGAAGGDETTTTRRKRLSRRKSSMMDDDATVVAGNQADGDDATGGGAAGGGDGAAAADGSAGGQPNKNPAGNNKKEILALPTDAGFTTHTVGEHVVATVKAQELDEHEGLDEASLKEHEEVTKVKNVAFLEMGQYQMETWYFSPLPKELVGSGGFIEVLYACEFSLNLFSRKSELLRFQARLPVKDRHPPGDEIYRNGNLSVFEVDAQQEEIYCQNLSYIAKLFLDHKTLYFSVSPFLFYVLCEVDERGYHPVGYFSKEKYSDVGYNLACILTFPAHQRKGYGRFIISFSYELTKKEEKVGSPEKPMSDLGQQAYKPYWTSTIIDFLLHRSDESALSIMDISKRTSIMTEDIVFTLNQLGLLKIISGVYFITAEKTLLQKLAKKYPIKEPRVDPTKLHWTPYLTDVKRDRFSIHSKKPSVSAEDDKAK